MTTRGWVPSAVLWDHHTPLGSLTFSMVSILTLGLQFGSKAFHSERTINNQSLENIWQFNERMRLREVIRILSDDDLAPPREQMTHSSPLKPFQPRWSAFLFHRSSHILGSASLRGRWALGLEAILQSRLVWQTHGGLVRLQREEASSFRCTLSVSRPFFARLMWGTVVSKAKVVCCPCSWL